MQKRTKHILLGGALILLGASGRILMQDLPNIEPITLTAILAGMYISRKSFAMIVPLAIIAISDLIIGNTAILFFTWTAWAGIGIMSLIMKRYAQSNLLPVAGTISAVLMSIAFFVWTNLGVWLTSGLYTKTFSGLLECFAMALPFFRTHLISNVILVATATTGILLVRVLRAYSLRQQQALTLNRK